jgi:hypothetical protein
MVVLPPDLSRLGDELTAAAARTVAERRRRRRRVLRAMSSAAAGILTVVILAPAALSPDSGTASLLARDGADTLVIRPPAKRPVTLVREAPVHGVVLARPPDRRPLITPSIVRRDA